MGILKVCVLFLRAMLIPKVHLAFENLALRQQVAVSIQSAKRPRLRTRDRVFWVLLSRSWPNWRSALAIVQPETVIRWHQQGFKLYWRWKSRRKKPGRPPIEREIRDLIRRMSRENPTWGAPRILSEVHLLGYACAPAAAHPRFRTYPFNPISTLITPGTEIGGTSACYATTIATQRSNQSVQVYCAWLVVCASE